MNLPPALPLPAETPPSQRRGSIANGSPIMRLRAALRESAAVTQTASGEAGNDSSAGNAAARRRAALALQAASAPITDEFFPVLTRYCHYIMHQSRLAGGMDGDDLAQDAWLKALQYLEGEKGARVTTNAHFKNLLYRCAQSLLIDRTRHKTVDTLPDSPDDENANETRTERLPERRVLPDVLRRAADDRWVEWLDALFSGTPLAFRTACRVPPRRRPVVYQAFVLIGIAGHLRVLRAETGARGQQGSALLRELTRYMRLPTVYWEIAEAAAVSAPLLETSQSEMSNPDRGVSEALTNAVCAALGTPPISRESFHVLRNEVRKLAVGPVQKSPPKTARKQNAKEASQDVLPSEQDHEF